jgi:hypothetical protein
MRDGRELAEKKGLEEKGVQETGAGKRAAEGKKLWGSWN